MSDELHCHKWPKCEATDVSWVELDNGDALPSCRSHRPFAVAMRELRWACRDAAVNLKAFGVAFGDERLRRRERADREARRQRRDGD